MDQLNTSSPENQPNNLFNSNNIKLIRLLILVAIFSSLGTYFVLQSKFNVLQSKFKVLTVTQPTMPLNQSYPSPISNLDKTENWKTFTNTKYNFQISVPSGWKITPYSENPQTAEQVNLSTTNESDRSGNVILNYVVIRVTALDNKQNLPLRTFLIENVFNTTDIEEESVDDVRKGAIATVDRMKKSKIAGTEVLTFRNREQTYLNGAGYVLVITFTFDPINQKSENFANQLFDQILSTFRFLDQNQ